MPWSTGSYKPTRTSYPPSYSDIAFSTKSSKNSIYTRIPRPSPHIFYIQPPPQKRSQQQQPPRPLVVSGRGQPPKVVVVHINDPDFTGGNKPALSAKVIEQISELSALAEVQKNKRGLLLSSCKDWSGFLGIIFAVVVLVLIGICWLLSHFFKFKMVKSDYFHGIF